MFDDLHDTLQNAMRDDQLEITASDPEAGPVRKRQLLQLTYQSF